MWTFLYARQHHDRKVRLIVKTQSWKRSIELKYPSLSRYFAFNFFEYIFGGVWHHNDVQRKEHFDCMIPGIMHLVINFVNMHSHSHESTNTRTQQHILGPVLHIKRLYMKIDKVNEAPK